MKNEKAVANKLIKAALAAGYAISVNDGEAWPIKRSVEFKKISDALASTDQDTLLIHQGATGGGIGKIWLVWGNSPEELIADYSDNDAIGGLVKAAEG